MPQTCQFSWQNTSTFHVFSSGFHLQSWPSATWHCMASPTTCVVQSMQNTAARLISGEVSMNTSHQLWGKCTGCLYNAELKSSLLWACSRQCRPGTAIAIRWMPDTNRSLQSSNAFTCVVPWMKTHLGDNVDSPGVYNTLPTSLHLMDNYKRFRCLLKAHLRLWFVMTIFSVLCIFLLTFGEVGSGRILK